MILVAWRCRDGHGRAVRVSHTTGRMQCDTPRFSIIREATRKSKDGRIDQSDFMNHCVSSTRYSLFTPMEASIIFHFAGRGSPTQRLALIDFAQLLDPKWRAPAEEVAERKVEKAAHGIIHEVAHSVYNFVLGGKCCIRDISEMMLTFQPFRCCGSLRRDNRLSY